MEIKDTQIKEPIHDSFPTSPNPHPNRIDSKEEKRALSLMDIRKNESKEKEKPQKELKNNDLEKVIEEKESKFKNHVTRLSFSFDKDRNETVIRVLDGVTGEVIRQIPSEEILNSIPKTSSKVGLFVDQKI